MPAVALALILKPQERLLFVCSVDRHPGLLH